MKVVFSFQLRDRLREVKCVVICVFNNAGTHSQWRYPLILPTLCREWNMRTTVIAFFLSTLFHTVAFADTGSAGDTGSGDTASGDTASGDTGTSDTDDSADTAGTDTAGPTDTGDSGYIGSDTGDRDSGWRAIDTGSSGSNGYSAAELAGENGGFGCASASDTMRSMAVIWIAGFFVCLRLRRDVIPRD